MEILDIHILDERARQTLKFVQQYEQLRAQVRELHPGYDLIIAKDADQPELMPVAPSKKGDAVPFLRLTGIQQIGEVLKKGPLDKSLILPEIQSRGGRMTNDVLNTYLRRGKEREIFVNFRDRIWGLPGSITNGADELDDI
jgi:hypothetical protein